LTGGPSRGYNAGPKPSVGAVAQLGERLVRNQEVNGSIPFSSTVVFLEREVKSFGKRLNECAAEGVCKTTAKRLTRLKRRPSRYTTGGDLTRKPRSGLVGRFWRPNGQSDIRALEIALAGSQTCPRGSSLTAWFPAGQAIGAATGRERRFRSTGRGCGPRASAVSRMNRTCLAVSTPTGSTRGESRLAVGLACRFEVGSHLVLGLLGQAATADKEAAKPVCRTVCT
jgi:hypothetical protein